MMRTHAFLHDLSIAVTDRYRKRKRRLSTWLYILFLALPGLFGLAACRSSDANGAGATDNNPGAATENALATAVAQQAQATPLPTATLIIVGGGSSIQLPTQAVSPTAPPATETPTLVPATVTPTQTATLEATSSLAPATPTNTATVEAILDPTAAVIDAQQTAVAIASTIDGDHFWLARPFFADGTIVDYAERTYPYGSTAGGRLQPHYGIDIVNPYGTIILAAGSGTVFFAGDDFDEKLFGPRANFYGNTVVIQHTYPLPNSGEPFTFYTLYGHLSSLAVTTGQIIQQFDPIGQVGQSGVAIGPHLHLEVRIGDPYGYSSTYNPELWLQSWPGYGVLAGRVMDTDGALLPDLEVQITSLETGRRSRTFTYTTADLNSDPYWQENWVMPDLKAGAYEVKVGYRGRVAFQTQINVTSGATSYLNIFVE